jgi:Tol biopolymer transport system component
MDNSGFLPCRVVPLDGSSRGRQVGPANGACLDAAWSKDGRWLYLTSNAGGTSHIWRQQFPEGRPEQITSGPTDESGIFVASDNKSLLSSVGFTTG